MTLLFLLDHVGFGEASLDIRQRALEGNIVGNNIKSREAFIGKDLLLSDGPNSKSVTLLAHFPSRETLRNAT